MMAIRIASLPAVTVATNLSLLLESRSSMQVRALPMRLVAALIAEAPAEVSPLEDLAELHVSSMMPSVQAADEQLLCHSSPVKIVRCTVAIVSRPSVPPVLRVEMIRAVIAPAVTALVVVVVMVVVAVVAAVVAVAVASAESAEIIAGNRLFRVI